MYVLAQADAVLRATNYAANQNDRWLFIALLIVGGLAIGWLSKWGMKQLEIRDSRIQSLGEELGKVREAYSQFAISTTERLAAIIASNSLVIERNTQISESKMSLLKEIQTAMHSLKEATKNQTATQ